MTQNLANHDHVKFRPVLTLAQIKYITSILSCDDSQDTHAHDIRKVLVPMIAKVEVGAISPAYKLSESHQKKLGDHAERVLYESGKMTPGQESEYESKILGM